VIHFEITEEVEKYYIQGMRTEYKFSDGTLYYISGSIFALVGGKYYRLEIKDGINMNDFVNSYDGDLIDVISFKVL